MTDMADKQRAVLEATMALTTAQYNLRIAQLQAQIDAISTAPQA
jgi:hypothetical protein